MTANPRILTPNNVESFAGLRIVPSREIVNNGLFLALYGQGGSGKTTTAAMLTKSQHAGRALLLDAEAGASAIAHLDTVDVAPITKWTEITKLRSELERVSHRDELPYWTYIIDNMTEIQAMHIAEVAGIGNEVQIQHYGKVMADILRELRAWRELTRRLGVHVIICLWEERDKDEETTRWTRRVYLTNKLAQAFPGVMNLVGHILPVRNAPDLRKISFLPGENVDAKFRVAPTERAATLPKEIYYAADKPVLADMLDTIRGDHEWPASKYPAPTRQHQSS